jgi:hypothetical protein
MWPSQHGRSLTTERHQGHHTTEMNSFKLATEVMKQTGTRAGSSWPPGRRCPSSRKLIPDPDQLAGVVGWCGRCRGTVIPVQPAICQVDSGREQPHAAFRKQVGLSEAQKRVGDLTEATVFRGVSCHPSDGIRLYGPTRTLIRKYYV